MTSEKAGKAPSRVYSDYQKNRRKQKYRLKKLLNDKKTDLGLPHDIVEYFIRVQKSLCESNNKNQSSEEIETKMQLLTNVCDQIQENPFDICTHQIISVTIQKLIAMMDLALLDKFLGIIQGKLLELIENKYASHIIQTTIDTITANNIYKSSLDSFPHITHLFDVLSDNISNLMTKVYASHVVCSYVQLLGGIKMDETVTSSRLSRTKLYNAFSKNQAKQTKSSVKKAYDTICAVVPKYYQKRLRPIRKAIIGYLSENQNLSESENFIGVFMCVLATTHRLHTSKVDALVTPILNLLDKDSVFDPSKSYLIQSICMMSIEDSFKKIRETYIDPNFNELLTHPCGNYVIQAYMSKVNTKEEATKVAEKAIEKLDDILNHGNFQVVVKLIDMAKCNNVDQSICDRLTLSILSTFKFESTEPSVDVIYQLLATEPLDPESPLSVNSDDDSKFNLHGSLLVEKLLGISKLVVDSFCSLYIRHLKCIMCNRFSGHIVNAFLESSLTSAKDVKEIVKILVKEKNHLATIPIICSKYGSYSFECIWNHVSAELKERIALSLDCRRHLLEENHFGAIVSANCNLALFHSDRDVWKKKYFNL